jgi:transposase
MELHRIIHADALAPARKYQVRLTPADRGRVERLLAAGSAPTRTLTHARILLKADVAGPGWDDTQIADALEVGHSTIARVRRAFVQGTLEAALHRRRPSTCRPGKLDGRQEARLVELACSTPPEGHARWTLRLLTDRLIELEAVAVSDETVRRVLKKTRSSRG